MERIIFPKVMGLDFGRTSFTPSIPLNPFPLPLEKTAKQS